MSPTPDHMTSPPATVPDRPPPRRKSRGVIARYVLPLALFVAVVGVIAWVAQYMPSWRAPAPDAAPVAPARNQGPPTVVFARTRAVWDAADPGYVREFERGVQGHFDFPFRSAADGPVELGLAAKSCDCTEIQLALLPESEWKRVTDALMKDPTADPPFTAPPTWQPLPQDELKGVRLEPGQGGLLRVTWNGRKNAGERLNLKQRIWFQSPGQYTDRQAVDLEVPVVMANVINFVPDSRDVGVLDRRDVGTASFELWSATRDRVDLKVQAEPADPLFEVRQREMTPAERDALQDRLNKDGTTQTRVKVAYLVDVTVHEQKAGKELEQGPFQRRLPLVVDDAPLDSPSPLVTGRVKSDVEVGVAEDRGRVQLGSFAAADGARKVIALATDPKVALEPAAQDPAYLEVKLRKKGTAGQRARWQLEVAVPPDAAYGPLPEDSAVTVRVVGDTPRLVRIPVAGNGTSGN